MVTLGTEKYFLSVRASGPQVRTWTVLSSEVTVKKTKNKTVGLKYLALLVINFIKNR